MYAEFNLLPEFIACLDGELDCHTDDCTLSQALTCLWTDAWNEGHATACEEEKEES